MLWLMVIVRMAGIVTLGYAGLKLSLSNSPAPIFIGFCCLFGVFLLSVFSIEAIRKETPHE